MCDLIKWGKNFFNNIDTGDITDNETFWQAVKPLFTDKVQTKSKITVDEEKKLFPERSKSKSFPKK